jgi:N-acetylglutamate synthase-like GNAT family acetyltransferase
MNSAETDCIVRATTNDIDRLARLIRLSFADVARRFQLTPENCPRHPSNYTRERVENDLERGVHYFILTAAGAAVGCVGVEQASPVTCYMERLSVLPEHRGNGYGTRLARHAVNRAKEMGAATVGIGIIAADTGLKHFYTTLGFKAGETQSFAHLPFEVAFLTILV